MDRFLCGVDFSAHSGRALAYALTLSHRLGAPVTVVTVVDPLLAEAANVQFGPGQFAETALRDLDAFVTNAGAVPRAARRPAVRVAVGEPAKTLIDVAAEEQASLIVVGTHGLGRMKRLVFGSTTLRLLRTTDRPILAVPPDAAAEDDGAFTPLPAPESLVCGIDFSESSKAAATLGAALRSRLSLPLALVHAIPVIRAPSAWHTFAESGVESRVYEAKAALSEIARSLGPPEPDVQVRLGEPAEVLGSEAGGGRHGIVLLGLGTHRPGSTTFRILTESRVPVIAVPSP